MAQTKLDIVNLALRELGESTIESFDESDVAELADGHYDLVRDSMLLGNRWSWLERHVELARTPPNAPPGEPATETDEDRAAMRPPNEWTGESEARRRRRAQFREEFLIPLTTIVQAVYPTINAPTPITFGWKRQGEFIHVSHDRIWADVTQLSSEPTFHRLFVNALVLAVGARLAIPVTEDAEISRDLERKAAMALRKAKIVDAQSQPVARITSFPYVRARVGGDRVRYGIGSYPT